MIGDDAVASTGDQGDKGFVLVTVLWGIVLLSAIALALSYSSRLELKSRGTLTQATEARLLADGIARATAARLVERDFPVWWRQGGQGDGTVRKCRSGGDRVTIRLIDAGGLVDLNTAPDALFERLLLGLGIPTDQAGKLASSIAEFRTSGNAASSGQADAYRAAGLPHGPKNAPFETFAELDQVLGMSPELYRRSRPHFTVHSKLPGLDLAKAPGELSAALRQQDGRMPTELDLRSTSTAFVVMVQVERSDGVRFLREAVVELEPKAASGFSFREWSAPQPKVSATQIPGELADCAMMLSRN
jgi:general secretion pathway protein K